MNVNLLIDAIVRQTMMLIAHLATAAGIRSPLAHIANQVFLDLVHELQQQGLGRKVIADMFGIALRTYHAKVQRVAESITFRGHSLWEVVYNYIEDQGAVSRAKVLMRFRNDDGALVRGVLHDLVQSSLISQTGRGDATIYRMVDQDEMADLQQSNPVEAAAALVWVVVHRHRPITRDKIQELVRLPEDQLDAALAELKADARIREEEVEGQLCFTSEACVIPVGSAAGWEAALFDHYQALVTAMCTKLRGGGSRSSYSDAIGGSTYTLDIWRGHPHQDEVLALLRSMREQATQLRERAESIPAPPNLSEDDRLRVIFYAGQTIIGELEEPLPDS